MVHNTNISILLELDVSDQTAVRYGVWRKSRKDLGRMRTSIVNHNSDMQFFAPLIKGDLTS